MRLLYCIKEYHSFLSPYFNSYFSLLLTSWYHSMLLFSAMNEVGGYNAMTNQYLESAANTTYLTESLYGNLSCGFPPQDAFNIFRGIDSDYPWPGLTFGLTLLATYFFCTNQVGNITFPPDSSHISKVCTVEFQ